MAISQENVGYVDSEYLRMVGALLHPLKQATYLHMHIRAGDRTLDVGCGPATDTIPLAALVGPMGEVVGVDYDPAMVDEAEQRAQDAGVSAWVHHQWADASELPFAVGHFDSCRSERVFQHIPDRRPVLAQMARVTKSGGWVVVADTDWGSCSIDTTEIDIERRFMRFFIEATHHHGYSGRELYRMFKEQGLVDVGVEAFPVVVTNYALLNRIMTVDVAASKAVAAQVITEDEAHRWRASLVRAEAEGTFLGYFTLLLAAGRKT